MVANNEVAQRLRALADEHDQARREAAAWLLEHPALSRGALRRLAEAAEPTQQTRWAVDILGRLGNERDVDVLANLLTSEQSRLAWDAAQALARHRARAALERLRAATRNENPEVAGAAAVALGIRGDESARPDLEALLSNADEGVRYRAVLALRELGAEASSDALRVATASDGSADVRAAIAEALGGGT
jgi:HEAT repeat protein